MAKTTFYKLAKWDGRVCTFVDGKPAYDTINLAMAAATAPGRYRISIVYPNGRRADQTPFDVAGEPVPNPTRGHRLSGKRPANRPMGGRPH